MKRTLLTSALLFLLAMAVSPVYGQTVLKDIEENKCKAGGVYYHYVYDAPAQTPAPEGYEPFYISHYGRHGSRWLSREKDYSRVKEMFDSAAEAGILTPFGKDVYSRVLAIYEDATGRAGALTPLGVRQHKAIADRMIDTYPEVFQADASVKAASTTYPRCILSMAAFCESLKENNPGLQIERASDLRTTRILNCFSNEANPELCDDFKAFVKNGKWKDDYNGMAPEYVKTGRLMGKLFKDASFFTQDQAIDLVHGLFRFAVNVQSTELEGEVSLFDIFTDEELYLQNIYDNYYFFVLDGPSSINKGASAYYSRILLEDILHRADQAIEGKGPAADLRFGHDTSIMPLLTLLQFKEFDFVNDETDPAAVAEHWSLYRLTPMATNIQFIFYRPVPADGDAGCGADADDVLVKVMHNEHEMHLPVKEFSWPYYRWSDVKAFYSGYLDTLSYPAEGLSGN